MTKRLIFSPLLICALSAATLAQDELPEGKTPKGDEAAAARGLKTAKQKKSYVVGYNFGVNLRAADADLDLNAIAQGLVEGLQGKEAPLTDDQCQKLYAYFEKEMQARDEARTKQAADHNSATAARFLADNKKREGVQVTDSGLQYEVLNKGQGAKPTADSVVRVHYEGKHLDGTVFDSSIARGEPAEFGVGQVIGGWTEALQLMSVGDKMRLYIPPELGYGERGTPGGPIGPNEVLVFEVELLDIVK